MIDFERAVALLKESAKTEDFESRAEKSKSGRVRRLRAGIAALRAKNATWAQIAERVSSVLNEPISMDTVRKAVECRKVPEAGPSPVRLSTTGPTGATGPRGTQPTRLPSANDAPFGAAGRQF
jgi:hypothetical protein